MRLIAVAATLGTLASACAPASAPPPAAQPCPAPTAGRDLIGKHVGAVSFAPGANVRVVCTTCAATEDHRPDRLNVRFDEATGVIRSVDCG